MVGLLSIQPLNVFNEVLPLTCYIHPADSTFRLLSRTWIIGCFEVHPLMTNRQKQKQNEEHNFSFSTSSFTCHSANCGRFVRKSICPMAFRSDLSRFASRHKIFHNMVKRLIGNAVLVKLEFV